MKPVTMRGRVQMGSPVQMGTRNGSPEERRDGAGVTGTESAGAGGTRPDPEVVEKPVRRRFTAEYKVRILHDTDRCEPGQLGALLRREGLYSSHLTEWRRQRAQGVLAALAPRRRGRPGEKPHPLARRVAELEQENTRLQRRLQQAEAIIEVQKKSPSSWGSP